MQFRCEYNAVAMRYKTQKRDMSMKSVYRTFRTATASVNMKYNTSILINSDRFKTTILVTTKLTAIKSSNCKCQP